ncbi:23S rRNA m(1)G-748 methyltransferase [Paenibacillus uliginis N3/975]|uniref:23S rRNA m(1)G-748 methyltransferase n=1 Tax=Paenibacillus uliginis N3/975 TaxID=1313296 RepID=A0A1X7HQG0_9BACL|nr:methyltransferase domain-containing protein [Paenibacillus uliginis]SMF89919.1 23S rRNA m(1)G-748 methyltransferase [Paenibacillus uliginis N3/975]
MTRSGKLLASARLMEQNEALFRCPVCQGALRVDDGKSLLCVNLHRFDLAKQGYVNMLTNPSKTKYDRRMFDARKMINEASFFEPLLVRLSEIISRRQESVQDKEIVLLDAGCGEGSHLTALRKKTSSLVKEEVLGIGIDISKEGVQIAARDDGLNIWCVADLAKCPFADKSFNVILNILSPSNYAEFERLLTDDGILIKVIPDSEYLKELRTLLYRESERREYSNEQTVELFNRGFELLHQERLQYKVSLDPVQLEHLIYMTPLSWGAAEEQVRQVLNHDLSEISCDFSILIGRKKENS